MSQYYKSPEEKLPGQKAWEESTRGKLETAWEQGFSVFHSLSAVLFFVALLVLPFFEDGGYTRGVVWFNFWVVGVPLFVSIKVWRACNRSMKEWDDIWKSRDKDKKYNASQSVFNNNTSDGNTQCVTSNTSISQLRTKLRKKKP